MMRWIRRSLRSVPMVAGLTTAIIVSLGLGGSVFLLSASFGVSTTSQRGERVENAAILIAGGDDPAGVLDGEEFEVEVDELIAVLDDQDRVVAQRGAAPPWVIQELANEEFENFGALESGTVVLGSDLDWGIVNTSAQAPDGVRYTVASAVGPQEVTGVYLAVPAVIVAFGAGGPAGLIAGLVVRRSLRRVEMIQWEVQQISLGSLGRRIPVPEANDGIARLSHTMNSMLERLERSHTQQNQFIADASHELRSPIAGLSAQLDVARRYPGQVDTPVLVEHMNKETKRIQRLVDDLLFLSRLETGNEQNLSMSIEKAIGCVETEIDRLNSNHKTIEIQLVVDSSDSVKLDLAIPITESQLLRLLENLVSNACRHAESQVKVVIGFNEVWFGMSVVDDGPGISAEDRQRVFDRFVRLDEARTQDQGGSGLGLAITKELVTYANGHIMATDPVESEFEGAHIKIALPLNR